MSSRLALVAADQHLALSVQKNLHENLGQSAIHSTYDSIRDHLSPKGGVFLLLVAGGQPDVAPAIRLIQEVRLMQWPCRIILLDVHAAAHRDLTFLDPYLTARLHLAEESWPFDGLVKER